MEKMDHTVFMKACLDLAARGQGYTSPNPMVGAVVVRDGKIVGKGYHQQAGGPHAEVHAINDAGPSAQNSTLYVNLEPCNHTGRTPPCTQKILEAGIRQVVVGMRDPNPGVRGGGIDYLRERGLSVITGVCEAEAEKLNEVFSKYIQTTRPFVTVKCAATLDGRTATRTGDSKWITGPGSRRFVHRLRHAADAIMVGVETVKIDDPSLTTRLPGDGGRDPIRIILDTRLSIGEAAKLLHLESESDTLIVIGDRSADRREVADKARRLEKPGVRILSAPEKDGRIDLGPLMKQLGEMGVASILIEGGSRVIASALRDEIVDKVLFFYAPKILGGDDGKPICSGSGPERIDGCLPVGNLTITRFDDDFMVEGYLGKPRRKP